MELHNTQSNKDKTRILIVDDRAIMGRGLTQIINREPDLMVCAWATDAAQTLAILDRQQIDLVILDMLPGRTNGIQLTKNIKSQCSDLPVLICTIHAEASCLKRALLAGAEGYITKDEATETIVIAIRRLLSGRDYVSETITQKLLKTVYSKAPTPGS